MMIPLLILGLISASEANLNIIGPQCGQIFCKLDQYCKDGVYQCVSCVDICNNTSHNADQIQCHKSCDKYMYSLLYDKMTHLSSEFHQLQNRQMMILIITIVLLILFIIIHGFLLFRWLRRRGYLSVKIFKAKSMKQKQCPVVDLTHANPHTQSPKLQIRTDMARSANAKRDSTVFSVDGSTIQTVSTPISTRYPAEDSTLDYSYDNRGMTVTPVADKPRGSETNF
ncbi:protein grindelwald [Phlebotomus argentipes]|uniref:protein grindelwald n=1 Tax=Phlebotomus argentipes TaxID=94469 RepID=UPI0028932559|nr:protein grindelwald [Phlebotomus argentipes]